MIVEALTLDLFPELPAFQLAGAEGRGRLRSALAQPRWEQHRTAQVKAAVLHHRLNKNHPYVDGNKRFAVTAMEWFLFGNHSVLLATNDELVQFSLRVADDRLSRTRACSGLRRGPSERRGLRIGESAGSPRSTPKTGLPLRTRPTRGSFAT